MQLRMVRQHGLVGARQLPERGQAVDYALEHALVPRLGRRDRGLRAGSGLHCSNAAAGGAVRVDAGQRLPATANDS